MKDMTELEKAIESWKDTAANAFADFVTGARSAAQAFHDFAMSVIHDLAAMFVRKYIVEGLFNAITGGMSGGNSGTLAPDYGGYGQVVNIYTSPTTTAKAQKGSGGSVKVFVESIVDQAIAGGRFDKSAGMAWGAGRVPVGR
jgi:phage-related minor tail protein